MTWLAAYEDKVRTNVGIPSDTTLRRPVADLYVDLMSGKLADKIWCQQIGKLFTLYAMDHSLIARTVQSYRYAHGNSGVPLGGHMFSELFIEEYDGWALVDPTLGVYQVRDSLGNVLSAYRFASSIHSRSLHPQRLLLLVADRHSGSMRWVTWQEAPEELRDQLADFYRPELRYMYHTRLSGIYEPGRAAAVQRLILQPAVLVVNGGEHGTFFFWLFRITSWLLMVLTATSIVVGMFAIGAKSRKFRLFFTPCNTPAPQSVPREEIREQ